MYSLLFFPEKYLQHLQIENGSFSTPLKTGVEEAMNVAYHYKIQSMP